jgi:hypothetical protein
VPFLTVLSVKVVVVGAAIWLYPVLLLVERPTR